MSHPIGLCSPSIICCSAPTLCTLLKNSLVTLNKRYNAPVEMEFAATITPTSGRPNVTLHLLQCRPQSSLREAQVRPVPIDLAASDRLFISSRMVPQGQVSDDRVHLLREAADLQQPARRATP